MYWLVLVVYFDYHKGQMSSLIKKISDIDIENDNDIVISGMSGRFPNSDNVAEFSFNLYNKIDMLDDDERRWTHSNPGWILMQKIIAATYSDISYLTLCRNSKSFRKDQ